MGCTELGFLGQNAAGWVGLGPGPRGNIAPLPPVWAMASPKLGEKEWERLVPDYSEELEVFQAREKKKKASVAVVSVSGNNSLVSVLASERKINPIGLQPA